MDPADEYFLALMSGDVSTVDRLLQDRKVDANKVYEGGPTPLILALVRQDSPMVDMLLRHAADAGRPCTQALEAGRGLFGSKQTQVYPLQKAIETGCRQLVELLISWGAHPSQCERGLQGLLVFAAKFGSLELLKFIARTEKEGDLLLERLDWQEGLHNAICRQDYVMMRGLLELGASPNRDYDCLLPLTLAASLNDFAACQILLDFRADIRGYQQSTNARLGNRMTPLSCAVKCGMDAAVSVLIDLGADVNSRLDWSEPGLDPGCSMLHIAVHKRNQAICKLLIDAGCDLNAEDNEGNGPLHIACRDASSTAMLEFLLEFCGKKESTDSAQSNGPHISGVPESSQANGCIAQRKRDNPLNINARNKHKMTALSMAIKNKNQAAVPVLLAQPGIDLRMPSKCHYSSLHHAAQWGNDVVVLKLLDAGAPVDAGAKDGATPLQTAVENGSDVVADILLERGARIDILTPNHQTLLHLAVSPKVNNPVMLEMLLERGLDVNAQNSYGETPLMQAARSSSLEMVQILTDHGALLNCRDYNQKETALSLAVYFGCEDNACYLIRHGADMTITDKRRTGPVYWSVYNSRLKTLMLLLFMGPPLGLRTFMKAYPRQNSVMKNPEFISWVTEFLQSPRTLRDSCRRCIRRDLVEKSEGRTIFPLVQKLPLPPKIQEYIMCTGEMMETFPRIGNYGYEFREEEEEEWD